MSPFCSPNFISINSITIFGISAPVSVLVKKPLLIPCFFGAGCFASIASCACCACACCACACCAFCFLCAFCAS